MTFWRLFECRMICSWNFMNFSSGHRFFSKKPSEVDQRRLNNLLILYFGFITIWWVFLAKNNFLWLMLKKKLNSKSSTFFLFKEKNDSTPERATARYTWNFFKIWVSRIISYLRRVRITCRCISYVHTEGTENENIRHKNPNFSCVLAISQHSQKPSKIAIFSKMFFSRKSSKNFLSNAVFRLL